MQVLALEDPKLVAAIGSGAVGVLPTDTIYGIVCSASDEQVVKRLYALKHREHKPGTVIAASIEQLVGLGIKARYLKAVEQFWPGAVSVVVPCGLELDYLHLDKLSLAVRVPSNAKLQKLLTQTGPMLTSSANLTREPVANTLAEAQNYFSNRIDFYVDGGDLSGREPSTIIRVVDDAIEVIREGAVKINEAGRIQPRT